MEYVGFEEALRGMKKGLKVGRKGWSTISIIRIDPGKTQNLDLVEGWMAKFYKIHPEIHKEPTFIGRKKDMSEIEVRLGIEDILADDWYVSKDIGVGCSDKEAKGIAIDYFPAYVCIKDDEIRGIKRGSILWYDKGMTSNHYYHYGARTNNKICIALAVLKEMYEYYQELKMINCEIVDEWNVRFKAVPKGEDAEIEYERRIKELKGPYRVERISEEEFNKKYPNGDCKENLAIAKDGKWHEFAVKIEGDAKEIKVKIEGDVKEIRFESGVLITVYIPTPKKDTKWLPKRYIGVRPSGPNTNGNLNGIWVEQESGSYICESRGSAITRGQLESDVINGYLVEIGDDINCRNKR